jgi:hypothetical protein
MDILVELKTTDGQSLGVLVASPVEEFNSGSRGFRASGKVYVNGKKHQVNCYVVEVGSKPKKKSGK